MGRNIDIPCLPCFNCYFGCIFYLFGNVLFHHLFLLVGNISKFGCFTNDFKMFYLSKKPTYWIYKRDAVKYNLFLVQLSILTWKQLVFLWEEFIRTNSSAYMYVTSFSSSPYFSNSEYWTQSLEVRILNYKVYSRKFEI